MKACMNVARFNFSHADYEKDKARFALADKVRTELDLPVATMLDTKGSEILLSLRREFLSGYPGTPIFSRFR